MPLIIQIRRLLVWEVVHELLRGETDERGQQNGRLSNNFSIFFVVHVCYNLNLPTMTKLKGIFEKNVYEKIMSFRLLPVSC